MESQSRHAGLHFSIDLSLGIAGNELVLQFFISSSAHDHIPGRPSKRTEGVEITPKIGTPRQKQTIETKRMTTSTPADLDLKVTVKGIKHTPTAPTVERIVTSVPYPAANPISHELLFSVRETLPVFSSSLRLSPLFPAGRGWQDQHPRASEALASGGETDSPGSHVHHQNCDRDSEIRAEPSHRRIPRHQFRLSSFSFSAISPAF